ncbi:MAG: sodium:calcium antiporter [Mariprofundaceae bacterium]
MMESGGLLLLALAVVFAAAQLFTNALEYLGERLGVSEGVTGSIFAAVGTAMPETIVPIVAIVAGGASERVNHEVGMGAIVGAPFMLGTLSLGLMALFAGARRGWQAACAPEPTGLARDVQVFLVGFGLAVLAGILPASWHGARLGVALALFGLYFFYLLATIRASADLVDQGHATEADQALYAARLLPAGRAAAVGQLLLALVVLILGARMFVDGASQLSEWLGVSALVISLLIVPVATELPEKINSILWIRKGKDTLAFGNITGAMVFQGTMIPAIGMLLMPWHFGDAHAAWTAGLALAGALWLGWLNRRGRIAPLMLLVNLALYAVFIGVVLWL